VRKVGAALVLASVLGGCGSGTTSDPPAQTGKFSEIYATLFPANTAAKCDSCHSQQPSNVSNGLLQVGADGDEHAALSTLTTATSMSRFCSGQTYVVPGHPESSLLYLKLTDHPPCGERMPLGGGALPAAEIEAVRSWIAAGAPDD